MSEEIDLKQLETPEILELIMDDLYDGLAEEVVQSVNELLDRDMTPYDVLTRGLVAGMEIVGNDFRDGILFVPEVLMAAKAMKAGMGILRPLLVETGAPQMGTLVIATVKGDIHDIGKNLVAMMMEGAGFNVINLGINTDADAFMNAINEHKPDIIGMSALLTTTMPYMSVVIETIKDHGLRDQIIVLVGGAPLNDAFAEEIGADAYCRDAAVAVETAKKLLAYDYYPNTHSGKRISRHRWRHGNCAVCCRFRPG
jgi:5-methyltetrahydrofolate--homocysteine methyltransferase